MHMPSVKAFLVQVDTVRLDIASGANMKAVDWSIVTQNTPMTFALFSISVAL